MFAGLLSEIRAYGEGLVIAEQIPGRLILDVIKNTAVKITQGRGRVSSSEGCAEASSSSVTGASAAAQG